MADLDIFCCGLFEEAKRFFELSEACTDHEGINAYQHAALMIAFCSLEAYVNSICDDFLSRADISIHEKGFLSEREVKMDNGEFKIANTLKMSRLEDRILFLHRRFSGKPLDKSAAWWSDLANAIKLRNELTHPKAATITSKENVSRALNAIISTLNALFYSIYKTPFPASSRGLQSKLNF